MLQSLRREEEATKLRFLLKQAGAGLTNDQIRELIQACREESADDVYQMWQTVLPAETLRPALVAQAYLGKDNTLADPIGAAAVVLGLSSLIRHDGEVDKAKADAVLKSFKVGEADVRKEILDSVEKTKTDKGVVVKAEDFIKTALPYVIDVLAGLIGSKVAGTKGALVGQLGATAVEHALGLPGNGSR